MTPNNSKILRTAMATLCAGLIGAVSISSASAADITNEPEFTNVEFGTGWYLRAGIGVSFDSTDSRTTNVTEPVDLGTAISAELGAGYRFNQHFRADVALNHIANMGYAGDTGNYDCGTYADPTFVQDPLNPVPVPQIQDDGTCYTLYSSETSATSLMASAYIDGPKFSGFTPYVGGGLGVAQVSWSGISWADFCRATADPHCDGRGVLPGETSTVYTDGSGTAPAQERYSPVFALMAGFGYELSANTTLDVGYRYTNIAGTSFDRDNGTQVKTEDIENHEIRAAVRFEIW